MASKKLEVELVSKVSGNGLKQAAADIKAISSAGGAAGVTIGKFEKELKAAQTALKGTNAGTKEFERLTRSVKAAQGELKKLKLGELDSAGVDRAARRMAVLQKRTSALTPALTKSNTAARALSETMAILPGRMGTLANSFTVGGKGAVAATAGILGVVGALKLLTGGIATASQSQQFEVSFDTLLGGVVNARKRIEELKGFASSTPFKLPEVAKASKVLETLTSGALSTGKGLATVGDLAASTGEDFSLLAVHVGRLYDGLQNGRAVGEAQQRLQELGIISASTRAELELLQKQGKKGDEVWDVAAKAFGRFSGETQKQSQTLKGAVSTLTDSFKQLLGSASRPVADKLTAALNSINSLLGFTTVKAEQAGAAIVASLGKPLPTTKELMSSYVALGDTAGTSSDKAETSIDRVTSAFDRALNSARQLVNEQAKLASAQLALEIEEIELSGGTDEEKEAAKAKAREANRVADYTRGQGLIRTELEKTAALRAELAKQQREEARNLASIEIQSAKDRNILDASNALKEGQGRRAAALGGKDVAPDYSVKGAATTAIRGLIPGLNAIELATPTLKTGADQKELAGADKLIKDILAAAAKGGVSPGDLRPKQVGGARSRLETASARETASKEALKAIAEQLANLDTGAGKARTDSLRSTSRNNAKVEELTAQRIELANYRKTTKPAGPAPLPNEAAAATAISKGQELSEQLGQSGKGGLAASVLKATDALRDGSTSKELERFAFVAAAAARQTDGTLKALADSTIAAGETTAKLLQGLINEQNKQANQLTNLANQIKNQRK